jgi:hypothetical protein
LTIRLRVSNQITFRVDGVIKADDGEQRFDFELLANRLPESELATVQAARTFDGASEALCRVVTGWRGVYDGETPAPFSTAALLELVNGYPGLVWLALSEYVKASGARAREKN